MTRQLLVLGLLFFGCGGGAAPGGVDPSPTPSPSPSATPSPHPLGTLIRGGDNLQVLGLTDDSFIVYLDNGSPGSVEVIPTNGGASTTITNFPSDVTIDGKLVSVFGVGGGMTVWTQAHGVQTFAGGVSSAATPAGDFMVFTKYVGNMTGEVWVAKPDGTQLTQALPAQTDIGGFAFGGGKFVGTAGGNLYAIDPATAEATQLATGGMYADSLMVDHASGNTLYESYPGNQLYLVTLAGRVTLLDPKPFTFMLSGDGKSALYTRMNGDLVRTDVTSLASAVLTNNASYIAESPDGNWLGYLHYYNSSSSLVSASTPASNPIVIDGVGSFPPFTADSSHFLAWTGARDPQTTAGTITAVPVDGSAPVKIADNVLGLKTVNGRRLAWTDASGDLYSGEPGQAPQLLTSTVNGYAVGSIPQFGRCVGPCNRLIYATSQSPAGIYLAP